MTHPSKVGPLLARWHLVWSFLVLIGGARPIIDFVF